MAIVLNEHMLQILEQNYRIYVNPDDFQCDLTSRPDPFVSNSNIRFLYHFQELSSMCQNQCIIRFVFSMNNLSNKRIDL